MQEPTNEHAVDHVPLELFFDGGCPLCRREVGWLKRRDEHGRIRFVDIDAAGFDASCYDRPQSELMARIHARLSDGQWITGVEVFREAYHRLGFPRIVRMTRWKPIAKSLDWAYAVFARNRTRLPGRCASGCATPNQHPD